MADDHDTLIELKGTVTALAIAVEAHNIASVERDTRIERGVEKVNGTVGKHDDSILILKTEQERVLRTMPEHAEMWTVYRVGRWIVLAMTLALIAQTAGLLFVALRGG